MALGMTLFWPRDAHQILVAQIAKIIRSHTLLITTMQAQGQTQIGEMKKIVFFILTWVQKFVKVFKDMALNLKTKDNKYIKGETNGFALSFLIKNSLISPHHIRLVKPCG